ncbi:MAG: type II toxin-antitoxin system VapC family toxin [Candidatus Acidiferrales bacterium]
MSRQAAFWDASAVVPLCVHEPVSARARALLKTHPPVVWWATPVEVSSAIERLRRAGLLDTDDAGLAQKDLQVLTRGWKEIRPHDDLRSVAIQLMQKYPLRAADGLQLAAATVWCMGRPAKHDFICSDDRLSDAARIFGFRVIRLR